jgi:1-acyl-sn-glycerol-3-phosphate acyltransferase
MANLLLSAQKRPGLEPGDVLLAVTTLSFDIATMELLLPLVTGAAVAIADEDDTHDGRRLASLIERYAITFMQATPATWRLLLDAGWNGRDGMTALSGGEVLTPSLAKALLARVGMLWNGYGPSEATIYTTFHQVALDDDPVPIGSPVDNVRIYVLDEHLQPLPPGVAGEIVVGGAGLARGYLNRAALTAASFVPDPFSSRARARMYRTGDRGRLRSDGALEFLGRTDHQVKLRGYRIELAEIEAALEGHPAVSQGSVVTSVDERDHMRLVGWVVPASSPIEVEELTDHLRRLLPEYMIPHSWGIVESLPLTPNGKIDRKKLAAAVPALLETNPVVHVAETDVERRLEQLWCSLLGLEHIDMDDRFHDIGGDSITLAEMAVQASELFGVHVELSIVLEHQTIRTVARIIEARLRAGGALSSEAPIGQVGVRRNRRLPGLQSAMLAALRLFVRLTTRVEVDGDEHLPRNGATLIASNHINWLDFPLMAATLSNRFPSDVRPAFVVAHRWKRWFHWVFTHMGHPIYVRRGEGDLGALEEMRTVLRIGGVVGIAPEGTFDHGELIAGKSGAARLASDTNTPVVPLAIHGQESALQRWRRLRRVSITFRFGSPLTVRRGIADQAELQRETDRIMESIAALLPVANRGVYHYVTDQHRGRS